MVRLKLEEVSLLVYFKYEIKHTHGNENKKCGKKYNTQTETKWHNIT